MTQWEWGLAEDSCRSPLPLPFYTRVFFDRIVEARPHRLVVRIPGSHPGNRGSTPRGVTKTKHRQRRFFVLGLSPGRESKAGGATGAESRPEAKSADFD